MTPDELRACITFANGIDPRVQMTAPNAELWGRTVGTRAAVEVKAAIMLHYERPAPPNRDRPTIDAATVRKIINEETARSDALQSAQRALPPARNPNSWRERHPEEWERLVIKGRDDRRAELAARGIPLTDWQLANQPRPEL